VAKVIITFEDDLANGGVSVKLKFKPEIDVESDELGTPAQHMALRMHDLLLTEQSKQEAEET